MTYLPLHNYEKGSLEYHHAKHAHNRTRAATFLVPPDIEKDTNVKNLKRIRNIHKEIVRLAMLGAKNTAIADELGVTARLVHMVLSNPIIKEEMSKMQLQADTDTVDIAEQIHSGSKEAVVLLNKVIRGDEGDADIRTRVNAAQDLLDRAGYGKITKVQGRIQHGYSGQIGIEAIKRRAREVGIINGTIVEEDVGD